MKCISNEVLFLFNEFSPSSRDNKMQIWIWTIFDLREVENSYFELFRKYRTNRMLYVFGILECIHLRCTVIELEITNNPIAFCSPQYSRMTRHWRQHEIDRGRWSSTFYLLTLRSIVVIWMTSFPSQLHCMFTCRGTTLEFQIKFIHFSFPQAHMRHRAYSRQRRWYRWAVNKRKRWSE